MEAEQNIVYIHELELQQSINRKLRDSYLKKGL